MIYYRILLQIFAAHTPASGDSIIKTAVSHDVSPRFYGIK